MIPRPFARLFALLFLALTAPLAPAPAAAKPVWAFERSDLTPDPAFRFGRLPNGMRYIIRHNATPKGTAEVRMQIDTGSLDERDDERGFAHFVEHMAFNGSARVPEGEMIKLLERAGLAFGADTNAQTSFEQTLYMLSLPRADAALVDTALMLMRETASELTFDPAAVERERGVVLSELRDGQGYVLDNAKDQMAFLYPRAHYPDRLPIGTAAALKGAAAAALRAFWAREYVPAKTTLILVGDVDAAAAEAAIRARFADWPARAPAKRPAQGRVLPDQQGEARIHLDPALSERVTVSRHAPWRRERDTADQRRTAMLRQIGYGVINRRLLRLSRIVNPPFRGAGLGTSAVFEIGRTTNLVVDTADKGWRAGLFAAAQLYREALAHGFTDAEVAEQVAGARAGIENAAASADTRSNDALVNAALVLLRDEKVPTTPASVLERFNRNAPGFTPAAVLAALRADLAALDNPLIRFQGRTAPAHGAQTGEAALRTAWDEAMRAPLRIRVRPPSGTFAYTDFGPPGTIAADTTRDDLGLRQIRFANGVRLNLKRTDLEKDRVLVRLLVDGGELIDTRDNPLATEMTQMIPTGGLAKHSQDDLQSLLAGRSVGASIAASGDVFALGAGTTRRDLELQLQLLAATITDPGWRPSADVIYHQSMTNFFARRDATPAAAMANTLPGVLSGGDPRFTIQPPEAYQRLTMAALKGAIADRLAKGAIELTLVGDFDPDAAIAMAARTFGALPPREAEFQPREEARQRSFTPSRGLTVIRHKGEPNQAIVRYVWPTTDDRDAVAATGLELLQEVTEIAVLDTVREALGKAYSPGAASSLSRVWRGWGTFTITASVDLADVAATRAAIVGTVAGLAAAPTDPDVLERARAPMRERLANLLKTNAGWLALTERAGSQPDRIARFQQARARLDALSGADLQALAQRYLAPDQAVIALVLPEGAAAPDK
ncbi:M16 family metallopeptidase [Novosphingobium sp. PASSN1]|uniref:M16 family metallopeptidase n=1 Tax=Novosphingobium sp. PASSN1 TaxID=2015561 RepID=UPI000BDC5A5A|nr:M16 family metallopeptidase [Novosphingobium sp. PASSN1]OYU34570.1 MAG: peptidase M16 [Novosphingobium sp. PASSN1]